MKMGMQASNVMFNSNHSQNENVLQANSNHLNMARDSKSVLNTEGSFNNHNSIGKKNRQNAILSTENSESSLS